MGKVSLCAAGTDKYGVAVAEVPDTHPSEPSQAPPVLYSGLAWLLWTIPSPLAPLVLRVRN